MKKTLLGTTAIVAAGLIAGSAAAADPIELSLGGWFYMAPTVIVSEGGGAVDASLDRNTYGFTKDYEITFDGSTTLDNGISVGFHMEMETPGTDSTGLRQDEQYIFVSGGFGEVRMGSIDGAVRDVGSGVAGCSQFSLCGQYQTSNVDDAIGRSGYVAINQNVGGNDAERLYYFSPRIAGLQFSASYAPKGQQGKSDGGPQPSLNGTGGNNTNNGFDVGVDFNNSFGGVQLGFGGAFGRAIAGGGQANGNGANPSGWNARASAGVAGFTVAGGYQHIANLGAASNTDYVAWVASAGYATGPVGVQVDYGQSVQGAGIAKLGQDTYLQNINLSGNYALGPGVTFDAGLNYTNAGSRYNSYALGAGLQVGF